MDAKRDQNWGHPSTFFCCQDFSQITETNYDIWRLFLQFMKFISVRLFPIREKKLSSFFCKTVKIYVNIQMCFVRRYFWPKVISLNLKFDFLGARNLSQLVLFKIGRNSTSLHNEIASSVGSNLLKLRSLNYSEKRYIY